MLPGIDRKDCIVVLSCFILCFVVTVLRRESWYRFFGTPSMDVLFYKIFSTNSFVIQNYFVILYQMNKI